MTGHAADDTPWSHSGGRVRAALAAVQARRRCQSSGGESGPGGGKRAGTHLVGTEDTISGRGKGVSALQAPAIASSRVGAAAVVERVHPRPSGRCSSKGREGGKGDMGKGRNGSNAIKPCDAPLASQEITEQIDQPTESNEVTFEAEVEEVMAQLLARAGADRQGSARAGGGVKDEVFPPACGYPRVPMPTSFSSSPGSSTWPRPFGVLSPSRESAGHDSAAVVEDAALQLTPLLAGSIGGTACRQRGSAFVGDADANVEARPLSSLPGDAVDFAAVAGLQARVERRASQLRRDMRTLAERKRELLEREAEEALSREAADHLERRRRFLCERASAATDAVRSELAEARCDFEAALLEIDAQLATLDRVRSVATSQLAEQDNIRRRFHEGLVAWACEARSAGHERFSQQALADTQFVQTHAASLVPAVSLGDTFEGTF